MNLNAELEVKVRDLLSEDKALEAVTLVQKIMECRLSHVKEYIDNLKVYTNS